MTTRGSLVLSPELVGGPVLSLSKDRRVVSFYQDKENKKLNNGSPIKLVPACSWPGTFEDDGSGNFEKIYYRLDFIDEVSNIYNCEHIRFPQCRLREAISFLDCFVPFDWAQGSSQLPAGSFIQFGR